MIIPRVEGHATLLADGTVLVVGEDRCRIAGANVDSGRTEVYDPVQDRWTEVGSLNKPRGFMSLAALSDGSALVLGGVNRADEAYSSTKLYDPGDREWSDGPLMARAGAVGAVVLSDGRVVAVRTGDTEILDEQAARWRRSTPPPHAVSISSLFPMADDLVGAIGGRSDEGLPTFLVFDPVQEQWREIGSPDVFRPSAIGLPDGSILVFGDDEGGSHVVRFSAVTGKWVEAAQLAHGRTRQQMTLLGDGRVLVAGGVALISEAVDGGYSVTEGPVLKSTEIYDADTDTWTPGHSLLGPRQGGLAIPVFDESVLIFGGFRKTPRGYDTLEPGPSAPCPEPLPTTERLVVGL